MSKTKTKYNKETVKTVDPKLNSVTMNPRHYNTREKIHVPNIKRPRKKIQTKTKNINNVYQRVPRPSKGTDGSQKTFPTTPGFRFSTQEPST